MELNRLHTNISDKETIIIEKERELDRAREDIRKLYDENHRL
jgi:hypothetical protein